MELWVTLLDTYLIDFVNGSTFNDTVSDMLLYGDY